MATTHSNDYQIKKIGTGLESGTWGTSTSQNFERVSDAIGRSLKIDIVSMPVGSTPGNASGTTPAQWVTLDSADSLGVSSDPGAEGRSFAVQVTCPSPTGTGPKLYIAGSTITTGVNRKYVIWNNVGGGIDLTVYGESGTGVSVIIKDGTMALVSVVSSSADGWAVGVHKLLDDITLSTLTFDGTTGSITFDGNATINIEANDAASFKISDGVNDLVNIDTTTGSEVITLDAASGVTVDMSGGNTQPAVIEVDSSDANALQIRHTDADNAEITIDTANSEVEIGTAANDTNLRVFGNLLMNDGSREIEALTNQGAALKIVDSASRDILSFDTNTTKPIIDAIVPITVPDISITGSDGYVEFGGEAFNGTGYGIRNNSGTMEAKDNGGSWTNMVSFATLLDALSTNADVYTVTTEENKSGAYDFGSLRIIFNTVSISSAPQTITLGTGSGTTESMNSELFTVVSNLSGGYGAAIHVQQGSNVLDASAGTFNLFYAPGTDVTYWAIGDSGA